MTTSNNLQEEYHFRQLGGAELPKTSRQARLFMRLHASLGWLYTERLVRRAIRLPQDVEIQPGFRCLAGRLEFSGPATLGDTLFVDYAPVRIGKNVGMSFKNMIVTSTHKIGDFSTIIAKPIIIEDDVWITSGVIVLGGVTIGKGSIIGAGSVVTKNIPPGCFAAGNPCRPIRTI